MYLQDMGTLLREIKQVKFVLLKKTNVKHICIHEWNWHGNAEEYSASILSVSGYLAGTNRFYIRERWAESLSRPVVAFPTRVLNGQQESRFWAYRGCIFQVEPGSIFRADLAADWLPDLTRPAELVARGKLDEAKNWEGEERESVDSVDEATHVEIFLLGRSGGYYEIPIDAYLASEPCLLPEGANKGFCWYLNKKVYLSTEDLTPEDVVALVNVNANQTRLELQKAHALQAMTEQLTKANRREPIPQDIKTEVWQRDKGRCVDCETKEKLEFDHIIPLAMGGSNTVRNLQLLCESCNRRKGASLG